MQPSNRVRTYLDPDAVGPLPRSSMADDSDELSAARTILRVPGSSTVEICADDVIEVVDPNRRLSSVPPVGYDTSSIVLPRRKLGRWVVGAVAVCIALLVAAFVQSLPRAPETVAPAAAQTPPATRPTEARPVAAAPEPARGPAPTPAATIGTLRVDAPEGQRVFVDGVALSAPAALLRCGPHDVAMGSLGRTRTIDVPCGGEVTVYR